MKIAVMVSASTSSTYGSSFVSTAGAADQDAWRIIQNFIFCYLSGIFSHSVVEVFYLDKLWFSYPEWIYYKFMTGAERRILYVYLFSGMSDGHYQIYWSFSN